MLQRRSLQQWTTQLPLMRHDLLYYLLYTVVERVNVGDYTSLIVARLRRL